MAGYVIAEIEVTDPEKYQGYTSLAPATVEQYGGRYLVRGGESASKEGGWTPARLVVLEFPSLEQASTWYDSPEYSAIRDIRWEATNSKMVFIEGA